MHHYATPSRLSPPKHWPCARGVERSLGLSELRHETPFCDWSDARWLDFLVSELAADDGVDLRRSLKKFEGDDPELRAAALQVCQHPKLKPLLPH